MLYKEVIKISKTRTKFKVSTTAKGIKDRQSVDYKTGEILTFMSKLEKQFYEEIVVVGMKDGTLKDYKLQRNIYCNLVSNILVKQLER